MYKRIEVLFLPVIIFISIAMIFSINGCSSEDSSVNPPVTGEVLLAEVSGDSIGVTSGLSTKKISISGSTLNFTDRDSARITFYYSGENNSSTEPLKIQYNSGSADIPIYIANTLNITPVEQYFDTTIVSPKVNEYFNYKIATTSTGFSYFKFRDLKIYKK
ncbi:MAG: hypothetical protein WAT71_01685 [Ignavibacteria bacterium]